MALSDREFMKSAMKFFATVAMCALPFAAFADWRLTMAPASVQVDFGAPGLLELRIRNTGDTASPERSFTSQGFTFLAVLSAYEVTPLSGGCGNWLTVGGGFTGQVATSFSIPEVLPGAELVCRYNFVARRVGGGTFDERFSYYSANALVLLGTIKIGGLTDLGATANLISARQVSGQSVNRYRLNVQNFGQFAVQSYSFGKCVGAPLSFTIDTNFPGGCSPVNSPYNCPSGLLFDLTAGPILPGERASCEFDTLGDRNPELSAIRLFPRITRPPPDNRLLLDNNAENDALRLVAADPTEVPTVSWLGLVGLIFGLTLLASRRIRVNQ